LQEPPHNRRKFARVPLETKITVVFSDVDARRQLWIDNIGEGGLFIRSDQPKPIGSTIRFEFLVRDQGPKVAGTGVVQWVNRDPDGPPGMGIKFVELNETGRTEILEVLREKKARPDSGTLT
jgi:uncharacterized protein (TIGR02266 family)